MSEVCFTSIAITTEIGDEKISNRCAAWQIPQYHTKKLVTELFYKAPHSTDVSVFYGTGGSVSTS